MKVLRYLKFLGTYMGRRMNIVQLNWIIGRKSNLSLNNKILVNKAIINAMPFIQRCQSKIQRIIANSPWYVSNHTLYRDLGMS